MMDYLQRAKELTDELTSIREYLHRHPELGNQEFTTSDFVEKKLREIGLDVKRIIDTGLVATLHGEGRNTGVKVAIRADMDALPVEEATGCTFSSENPGAMHACGHDIHMTSALGAAMLLSENMSEIDGDVVFLFQPNEERTGGAKRMIEQGALEGVSAVFGGHVCPDLPLGKVGIRYGKFYAASDVYKVTFKGRSCHGATPEKGIDALLAAAEAVTRLKELTPFSGDKCIISTCLFNSGNVCNVIAGEAVTYDDVVRAVHDVAALGVAREVGHLLLQHRMRLLRELRSLLFFLADVQQRHLGIVHAKDLARVDAGHVGELHEVLGLAVGIGTHVAQHDGLGR